MVEQLRTVEVEDHAAALTLLHDGGFTDGLPVVAPTPGAVVEMVAGCGRSSSEVLGVVPPSMTPATVEMAAVDAVMAGCPPSAFPVVLAGLEAILTPAFRLQSVQTSTSPATPLLIVSGPGAARLGVVSGTGCLGPGPWPNLAIGRAVRLVMTNIGLGPGGDGDQATLGSPFKVGACFAERLDVSPWPGLHERRGFDASDTAVTAAGVTGAWQISEPSASPDEVIRQVLFGMATLGHCAQPQLPQPSELLLVLSPGIAAHVATRYPTVDQLQEALFEAARVPADWLAPAKRARSDQRLTELGIDVTGDRLPIAESPDCFVIAVAGGDAGVQSIGLSTSVLSRSVTTAVTTEP